MVLINFAHVNCLVRILNECDRDICETFNLNNDDRTSKHLNRQMQLNKHHPRNARYRLHHIFFFVLLTPIRKRRRKKTHIKY